MEILIIAVLIGIIPATIARSKGRNFMLWWIFGALLFIAALPAALILKPDKKAIESDRLSGGDLKKCPFCAELIKRDATVCRYCDRNLKAIQYPQFARTGRQPAKPVNEVLTTAEETSDIYLFFNEQKHGPFSFAQVQQMRIDRKVPDTATYWREGLPEWAPISDFQKLF
jgi:hypothetical protein